MMEPVADIYAGLDRLEADAPGISRTGLAALNRQFEPIAISLPILYAS
jgi:hypothetical protein